VLGFGDRLLLAYYASSATVGVYVAMSAATINVMNAASAAANRVMEPTLFAASGSGEDPGRVRPALRLVDVTSALLLPLAIPIVVVYALWPGAVLTFFASSSYRSGASYLWLLLVASTLFLAAQQLMYRGFILKRPGVYVPLRFAHAALLAAGLVFAIPRYGLTGMIVTIAAAHGAQLVLVAIMNRVRLRLPDPGG
jgi:O-antigen/teichoic acid export membrane protein